MTQIDVDLMRIVIEEISIFRIKKSMGIIENTGFCPENTEPRENLRIESDLCKLFKWLREENAKQLLHSSFIIRKRILQGPGAH